MRRRRRFPNVVLPGRGAQHAGVHHPARVKPRAVAVPEAPTTGPTARRARAAARFPVGRSTLPASAEPFGAESRDESLAVSFDGSAHRRASRVGAARYGEGRHPARFGAHGRTSSAGQRRCLGRWTKSGLRARGRRRRRDAPAAPLEMNGEVERKGGQRARGREGLGPDDPDVHIGAGAR
jgi:hypothetical protein